MDHVRIRSNLVFGWEKTSVENGFHPRHAIIERQGHKRTDDNASSSAIAQDGVINGMASTRSWISCLK